MLVLPSPNSTWLGMWGYVGEERRKKIQSTAGKMRQSAVYYLWNINKQVSKEIAYTAPPPKSVHRGAGACAIIIIQKRGGGGFCEPPLTTGVRKNSACSMPTTIYRNMQKSLPNKRTTRIVIKALKSRCSWRDKLRTDWQSAAWRPTRVCWLRGFYVVISGITNQSINCTKVWLNLMTRRDHYRHWLTAISKYEHGMDKTFPFFSLFFHHFSHFLLNSLSYVSVLWNAKIYILFM